MKTTASLAALAVAAALVSTPVFAADLMIIDDATMSMATGGGGWDGAYVGGGVIFETSTTVAENLFGLQGVLGVNATFDSFLVGGEVYVQPTWSSLSGFGAGFGGQVRGGVLASEEVLLYGALGAEIEMGGNTFATFGGGIEFMATDDMSIDLEYKYYWGINNGWQGHHVGATANWHF